MLATASAVTTNLFFKRRKNFKTLKKLAFLPMWAEMFEGDHVS